jgi:hypothetical protein
MIPEDRAKELFDSFNNILNDTEKSKECVMLCIKEIESTSAYSSDYLYGIDYWNKVKKFVKKIE